jgi:hypothetical protein
MFSTVVWIIFTLISGATIEPDHPQYLIFGISMLYFTYILNEADPVKMTPSIGAIYISIPSCILWYIADGYNYFLSLNPISHELFTALLFMYFYVLIYVASEFIT